ncbi:MAG: MBL fold metallo-hydrolase [Candidatus Methylomirabilia bacterium]
MVVAKLFDPTLKGALCWLAAALLLGAAGAVFAAEPPEKDRLAGPVGELEITFLGHGSLILSAGGAVVHVDPYSKVADYATLPKADVILITHEHQDHLDPAALQAISKESTHVIASPAAAEQVKSAAAMENGARAAAAGIAIEAVPAYNIKHERSPGVPFHPRGRGNGYVVTLAGLRVYVAGDTENIPEMTLLAGVEVAFLPMNLPYTMTPEMAADAARMIGPKILYPYHFGETDTSRLVELLKDRPGIEVRIRRMP